MAGRLIHALAPHQPEATAVVVILSAGARLFDADGDLIKRTAPHEQLNIEAEVVDEKGRHYYQLDPDRFVLKNDVTTEIAKWQAAHDVQADYHYLNAENINQIRWGMPNGCEPAALLEGLHLMGYAQALSYLDFIAEMPRATDYNPYHGFGGEPDENVPGHFEAIFPEPLAKWARQYGPAHQLDNAEIEDLRQLIAQKKPIVTYVTVGFETPESAQYSFGEALSNNHAVLLDGYFGDDLLHVSDPIDGRYWMSTARFKQAYDARKWAVSIG